MARAQGNTIVIQGRTSYYFIDWVVNWQDDETNRSNIGWNCQYYFDKCDAQLDNVVANLGGATRAYNGGRVYNYAANFTVHAVYIAGGSFDMYHNNDGSCLFNVNGGIDVYQSGRSSTNQDTWLPGLYRYAELDGFSWGTITDVSVVINLSVNRLSDYVQVSLDNGATYPYGFSGDWWDKSVTIGSAASPLRSGTTYNVRVQTRRKASGLWATSGTYTFTTAGQNNFFDVGTF